MKGKLLVMLFVALSFNVLGQDTIKLDLQKSLEIALSDNPTIKIANKEIERQEYVRKETAGNLLPQISASGMYNRSIIKSTMSMGDQKISFEPDNTVAGTANLALPLFAPSVYSTLKLNDEQMRAAVEKARASKILLVSEVKKSYYNILLAELSLEVLGASELNLTQTVDQTRSRFSQGLASEYDLLTAEVQLSNLRPTIIQTQNSIKVAKQLFKMYLYLPSAVEVDLIGSLSESQAAISNFTAELTPDIKNNSDIRNLELQESILKQQFKVMRTQRMPTLSAVSSFQIMGRDKISFGDFGGTGTSTTSKTFERQTPMSAGIQLSVPIFAGLTKVNRERQLKNNIEQIRMQRDYIEQSVDVQARTSVANLITAREQMLANEKTIAQAQKGYDISRTRYNSGIGTILELNSAELSLTQAKLNHSQSMFNYLSAEAEYAKVLGNEF